MINDTLSDMLTRLRNGCAVQSATVVLPLTRLNQQICQILEKEGYIAAFRRVSHRNLIIDLKYSHVIPSNSLKGGTTGSTVVDKTVEKKIKSSITNLRRLSKPGARIYTTGKQMPKVFNGIGIIIVSTSQGIMTDREARFRSLGGELLCSIW